MMLGVLKSVGTKYVNQSLKGAWGSEVWKIGIRHALQGLSGCCLVGLKSYGLLGLELTC